MKFKIYLGTYLGLVHVELKLSMTDIEYSDAYKNYNKTCEKIIEFTKEAKAKIKMIKN